jgi:hypothetical protein
LPVRNVLLKNIDVLITKDFLKVNAPSIKYIQVIDFALPVNPEHPSTKVTLHDDKLEINLFKLGTETETPKLWDHVQAFGLSKEDLRLKREESLK